MPSVFKWFGDKVKQAINDRLDTAMRTAGKDGVAIARRLVPVDTGQLRDSIGYTYQQDTKTLTLYADKFYAAFVELGTRRNRAQPFMRPAMQQIQGRMFKTQVALGRPGTAGATSGGSTGPSAQTIKMPQRRSVRAASL